MIRIFVGFEEYQHIGFDVLLYSIYRRSSLPVQISPLVNEQIEKEIGTLPRSGAHRFTFSRFLIPHLCNYEGYAIYMDCDQLMVDDIAKLWEMRREDIAVMHADHQGTRQQNNRCSVMLLNCEKLRCWSPEEVNACAGDRAGGWKKLHGLTHVPQDQIAKFSTDWNYLVAQYPERRKPMPSLLHFTDGGPWDPRKPVRKPDYEDVWLAEFNKMLEDSRQVGLVK